MKSSLFSKPVLIAICLIGATWISANTHFKTQRLDNAPIFSLNDAEWKTKGAASAVILNDSQSIELTTQDEKQAGVKGTFSLGSSAASFLTFQTVLRKTAPPDTSSTSRRFKAIVYLSFSQEDKLLRYAAALRIPAGRLEATIDDLVLVPNGADAVSLSFYTKEPGHWILENVRLVKAEMSPCYKVVRSLIVLCWGLFSLYLLVKTLSKINAFYVACVFFTALLIVLATAFSSSLIRDIAKSVRSWLPSQFNAINTLDINSVLAYGHTIMFVLVTLLLLALRKKLSFSIIQITFFCVLLAVSTEALQRHSFTRSPEFNDLLLDFVGIGIAVILYLLGKSGKSIINARRQDS